MLNKIDKAKVVSAYKINAQDMGSVEVQIALLTKQIEELTEHFKKFSKDFGSKRGLQRKVNKRRSLLLYLSERDAAKCKQLTERLGMRK
jgi:small subunit ribosomal protein S15